MLPAAGQETFVAVAPSCHDCLIVCPVVGIASNCHDLGWLVPVPIYRSTITSPLITFPALILSRFAVAVKEDLRVMLSPVFRSAVAFPKDKVPTIFKVSPAAPDTVSPDPSLLTIRSLTLLLLRIAPETDW